MKKNIQRIVAATLSMALVSSLPLSSASAADQTTTLLQENNFTIVSEDKVGASFISKTFENVDANENLLFETATFETALQQPENIKKMILRGNAIAVFDSNGVYQSYEERMKLPIGFEEEEENATENGITVGRIYRTDSSGNLHIARVRVDPGFGDKNDKFNEFMKYLDKFMEKDSIDGIADRNSTRSASMDFIGSVSDYFTGESEKGDIDATYEVSTVQGIDNYDYYTIHGYIDYTPGDALHSNGYDVDEFQSILSGSGLDVHLYKTGPNTMIEVNEYSVDVGFTGSLDGAEVAFGAGWSGEVPDVNIYKNKTNATTCVWEVDVNDWAEAADHTISFEPGGTFRAESSNNNLYVHTQNKLIVDSITESPSTAVIGDLRFYCSAQGVDMQ